MRKLDKYTSYQRVIGRIYTCTLANQIEELPLAMLYLYVCTLANKIVMNLIICFWDGDIHLY